MSAPAADDFRLGVLPCAGHPNQRDEKLKDLADPGHPSSLLKLARGRVQEHPSSRRDQQD
jgi:hypothetical protein